MRDHSKSGMSGSGSVGDERIGPGGSEEKIGEWSEDEEDGGVLAGDEDVGVWSDEDSVEEGYQAHPTQPGGAAQSESERPDSSESRWGSEDDDSSSRR